MAVQPVSHIATYIQQSCRSGRKYSCKRISQAKPLNTFLRPSLRPRVRLQLTAKNASSYCKMYQQQIQIVFVTITKCICLKIENKVFVALMRYVCLFQFELITCAHIMQSFCLQCFYLYIYAKETKLANMNKHFVVINERQIQV